MRISDLLTLFRVKTRVIHRLPGRIRIEVPVLRKVPPEHREGASALIAALPLPAGVKSLRSSFVTSNLLIEYDPEIIREEQIFTYINGIVELVANHRGQLANVTPAEVSDVLARVTEHVKNNVNGPNDSLKEVVIPTDVWQKANPPS